jgi:teichuronic acid exporter
MTSGGNFRHAISGLRWMGASKVVTQGISWVVTIIVIRLLKPSDYGLMAMVGMVTILTSMLLDAGLGIAFVQRGNVPGEVLRSANGALLLGSVGAVIVIVIFADLFGRFFSEPKLAPVLRLASLQFIIGALTVVPSSTLTSQMRFKALAITQACASLAASLVTIWIAAAGGGVWSLVIGTLAGSSLRLILLVGNSHSLPGFSLRLSLLRSYLSFSGYLVVQRFAWFWVEQADQLVVGKMLGASSLGAYSVARNLSQMPLDRVAEIVNQVALPSFSAVQSDVGRWHEGLLKLMRLSSAFSFPLFWGMAAVAPVAFPLLLGKSWGAAGTPFILMCLVLPLRTAHSLAATVLLALGRADTSLQTVLIWAAVLTPMFLFGIRFDITGVAAAWAIGFPLVYLFCALIMSRALKLPRGTFLAPMLPYAAAAAGCCAVVLALGWEFSGMTQPAPLLALQVIAGALTYLFLLRLLSRSGFNEVFNLAAHLVGRR